MLKQTVWLGQICLCYEFTSVKGEETFPKENTPHLMIKGSTSQCSWYLSKERGRHDKNGAGHAFESSLEKNMLGGWNLLIIVWADWHEIWGRLWWLEEHISKCTQMRRHQDKETTGKTMRKTQTQLMQMWVYDFPGTDWEINLIYLWAPSAAMDCLLRPPIDLA